LFADVGVRDVIEADPEANQIVEAIIEFRAGAVRWTPNVGQPGPLLKV